MESEENRELCEIKGIVSAGGAVGLNIATPAGVGRLYNIIIV